MTQAKEKITEEERFTEDEKKTYREQRRTKCSFKSRDEYLEHELSIMAPKRWKLNLPKRDFNFEYEDLVPALAATIGKIVMVSAVVAAFADRYGLSQAFVIENTRFEMLIAAVLFCILFSGVLNPLSNLAGTHGPMIPMIPLIVASGGHPLALGVMVGFFGVLLSATNGGSKLVKLTGVGVRGGLLIYLGAVGMISQVKALGAWAASINMPYVSFAVLFSTILIYAYLAKVGKRWMSIPIGSAVALVVALALGAPLNFITEPGMPHLSPLYWWGETTGWKMGLPGLNEFIAVTPFAILAVAMWSPDFLGHRVFQELNYPKKADKVLMNVDDTMAVCSLRQIVGTLLGGGNLASSWGTYMIPAAIAKRPIPAGAILTGVMCIFAVVLGYPMDLAVWPPVLRVALLVGVFLPLLEAGMQMIKDNNNSQSAGVCLFASALVNPVFGWSLTMLLDNTGLIGDFQRRKDLHRMDRLIIPLLAFVICVGSMAAVGMLPGIPAIIPSFR
ncbi:MAG: DUF3360 family protein [Deltaproteobacteria bacterium]|nr:DUF3360 family protein [Deltaproteobacteria bacterium]